jgi:hypothetical protein
MHRVDNKLLDEPVVSAADWKLNAKFHAKLDAIKREVCNVCNEERFDPDIRLHRDVLTCYRCRKQLKQSDDIASFSIENRMDPGEMPSHLQPLSIAEELLIARVHVLMSLWRVKGVQYKYSGHIINFFQNTSKIISKLPSLPKDIGVLLLKPPSSELKDEPVQREYDKRFNVRRREVEAWLRYLVQHHPDYKGLSISVENLDQLPENGSILDELPHLDPAVVEEAPKSSSESNGSVPVVPEEEEFADDQLDAVLVEESCVPNLDPSDSELRVLQDTLGCKPKPDPVTVPFSLATMGSAPVSEFDTSHHIARMAFPTLFPRGQASFNESRDKAVDPDEYIRHLLNYKDGRFARHPQFRYWAFNTLMRARARKTAAWFTKKHPNSKLSLDELKDMAMKEDSHLADIINRKATGLRGTRPYWAKARKDLETMVHNIGPPSLFFTLSAADMQWPDLYRHLPPECRIEYDAAAEPGRAAIACRFLQQYPHVVAEYLHIRFRHFFNEVMKKKFTVTDHWYRFEWQNRGSGHIHGFLWIDGAPAVDLQAEYVDFWGAKVVALNPDGTLPPAEVHPSSRSFAERHNSMHHLAESLNRYQRHTKCTPQYCQRRVKGGGPKDLVCRFHFPQDLSTEPCLGNKLNPKHLMFEPVRNDPLMGKYMPLFTMSWNANTDASPCGDITSVVAYLAKYVSKEEKNSMKLADVSRELLGSIKLDSYSALRSFATKLMNRSLMERDWSAQEICHIMMDLKLRDSSRSTKSLDLRPVAEQKHRTVFKNDQLVVLDTALEKYCRRDRVQEDMTFWQSVKMCDWSTKNGFQSLRKEAVVDVFPKYKIEKDRTKFCRAKLMLHHPFRTSDLQSLLTFDDHTYSNWEDAYDSCRLNHGHDSDPLGDPTLFEHLESDNESLASTEKNYDEHVRNEETLNLRKPGRDGQVVDMYAELGNRPLDRQHDWLRRAYDVEVDTVIDDMERKCKNKRISDSIPGSLAEAGNVNTLNAKQREVFDLYVNQYVDRHTNHLLTHLDGVAGTGKSHVIDMVSRHLTYHASQRGSSHPGSTVLRAAPTGVAAHNIEGSTLHSLFHLPVKGPLKPMEEARLTKVQEAFRDCWLIIGDEKSMIGLSFLGKLDQRLRQIRCSPDEPFGGINMLFCGDFGQLAPVADSAMYSEARPKEGQHLTIGRFAYQAINRTIVLDEIMRQKGQTANDVLFRQVLEELRTGPITKESWAFLISRTKDQLSDGEWGSFHSALRLYGTRDEVGEYNMTRLARLGRPVLRLKAENHGPGAVDAPEDEAGNLANEVLLAGGANVMVTRNIWTNEGLVNGTMGKVHSFLWHGGVIDLLQTMPAIVMIQVDGYKGLGSVDIDGHQLIPILPVRNEFELDGHMCNRFQIPLRLAFAITIHKSQGLTLSRVVVNLNPSSKHINSILAYVALSRVRGPSGLAIEDSIIYDKFTKIITNPVRARLNDGFRRQELFHKIMPMGQTNKDLGERASDAHVDAPPPYESVAPPAAPLDLPPPYDGLSMVSIEDDDAFSLGPLADDLTLADAILTIPYARFQRDTLCDRQTFDLFFNLLNRD